MTAPDKNCAQCLGLAIDSKHRAANECSASPILALCLWAKMETSAGGVIESIMVTFNWIVLNYRMHRGCANVIYDGDTHSDDDDDDENGGDWLFFLLLELLPLLCAY